MSNLTQFAPFAGGGLKSFQTGFSSGTLPYVAGGGEDNMVRDITISAVVVAKTITAFQGYPNGDSFAYPTTRMTSTTNLRIASSVVYGYSVPMNGRWQAAEAN